MSTPAQEHEMAETWLRLQSRKEQVSLRLEQERQKIQAFMREKNTDEWIHPLVTFRKENVTHTTFDPSRMPPELYAQFAIHTEYERLRWWRPHAPSSAE